MPIARISGRTVLLLLAAATSVFGQTKTTVVSQPTAEVRSGPSGESLFYVTNQLRKGDHVEIVKTEAGGWLAIKPPAGSVSWVNKRFLKPYERNVWTVESEADVEVLYGSEVHAGKPNVRSVWLKRGAMLQATGLTRAADDGNWLAIKSPDTEVRYIRAVDVSPGVTASAGSGPAPPVAAESGRAASNSYAVQPVPPPAAEPPGPANAGLEAAQRAEKEGRARDAIALYDKLAQETANTDPALSIRSSNQASILRHQGSVARDTRLRPVAAGSQASYTPQGSANPCAPSEYMFRGRLRKAYQSLDYKPTFVLENNGQIVAYVTSAGANLDAMLSRTVEVSGPACYCGSVRCNYVRATCVTALP
jgi:hypothetical protein